MSNNNQLKAMINKHGHGILNDTYRCKALTLDYFSVENTRQKELLKLSIDQKIPSSLITFIKNSTYTLEIKQVAKKLKETSKINQEDAEWIIKIWEEGLFEFFYELLFSGINPRVVEIIGNRIQVPDWLSVLFDKFLEKIDPEKMFSRIKTWDSNKQGPDYSSFPFENLPDELEIELLNQIPNYPAIKTMTSLNALVAIKKYAVNIPKLFEIERFEKNIDVLENWDGREKSCMRKVVIDHLAYKVKASEDVEGGYDKEHGEFVLLLLSLNHPEPTACLAYLIEKGTFLFDVHFKFMPEILLEKGDKSKNNLVYSMLKNKWIKELGAVKMMDSKFLKIKREVGSRFRLVSNPFTIIYLFLGSFIEKITDDKLVSDKYEIGRMVGVNLFIWIFITSSFLSFWTQRSGYSSEDLTKIELLHTLSFGLIAAVWGCCDFFSKTNQYGKQKTTFTLNGEAIWSGIGIGLSVFFCLFPGIWGFYPFIYLIELFWFFGYFGIIKS